MSTKTAYQKFAEVESEEPLLKNESALERLRFFCFLAMKPKDWMDAEIFLEGKTFTHCKRCWKKKP